MKGLAHYRLCEFGWETVSSNLSALACKGGRVDGNQKINRLFDEVERLARSLKESPKSPERRELLRDMRVALDEADGLILPKSKSANY
jgi:hypothetical protein